MLKSPANIPEWIGSHGSRSRVPWPVWLSLLPAFGLAVFAWISLRADRRWAENDARQQAQTALLGIRQALTNRLESDLEILRRAASAWSDWAAAFPSSNFALLHFQERFPDVSLAHLAIPLVRWNTNRVLLQPAPLDPTPVAPAWFRQLSAGEAVKWSELLAAFESNNGPALQAAVDRLSSTAANPEAVELAAQFRSMAPMLGSVSGSAELLNRVNFPTNSTPGGLPLSTYVYAVGGRIQSPTGSRLDETFTTLSNLVRRVPSVLDFHFLTNAQVQSRTAAGVTDLARTIALRRGDDRARSVAAAWVAARLPADDGPHWLTAGNDRWLVNSLRSSTNPAVAGIFLEFIPEWAIHRSIRDEFSKRGAILPAGLSPAVSLNGEAIIGPQTRGTSPPEVLAALESPAFLGGFTQRPATLRLAAVLTDPGVLFSRTRRRQQIFATLVGLSLGVAGLGSWLSVRAVRRLEALVEQRGNFVAAVSHELRAPIASVRLLAESLERGAVQTDAKRQEYYGLIARETRRLAQLIGNVLDFGRLERGQFSHLPAPTDARTILTEAVNLMQPQAADRRVALRLELPPAKACTVLSADAAALQRAIVNLVDNALKHSPPGSTVQVGLATFGEPATHLEIAVTDQGPGIAAAEQVRIFEPFQRLGPELRRETPGVGLGLALVRHIAEKHAGRVTVESTVGHGSIFRLRLPLKPTAEPEPTTHHVTAFDHRG